MKQRPRIYYTQTQKALMWERWKKGESLQHIAQLFDRDHSSIQRILLRRDCFLLVSIHPPAGFSVGVIWWRARASLVQL